MSFEQSGIGYWQYYKGKKMMRQLGDRPTYEIPEEISANLSQAQLRSLQGLSADAQRNYVENIQRSMQTGIAASNERGGGLANIGTMLQQQNDAYGKLLQMDEQQKNVNVQDLYKAREGMAQQQLASQEINKFQPYRLGYNEAQAMIGAGMQNIIGGWQATGNTFTSMFSQGKAAKDTPVGNQTMSQDTSSPTSTGTGGYYGGSEQQYDNDGNPIPR